MSSPMPSARGATSANVISNARSTSSSSTSSASPSPGTPSSSIPTCRPKASTASSTASPSSAASSAASRWTRASEVAAGVGIQFHLDKLTRTPNTLKAHRLIRLAGQKGVQDGVVESLFKAYFCNGADLGNDVALADIGQSGGLDRDAVLAMLASD